MDRDASTTSAVACGPRATAACAPRGSSEGRASASATPAIKRQRSASSRSWRSRRRRAFCRCERSTNSMAPNSSGRGLRRLKRCTRMGTASAKRPHRYAGCAKTSRPTLGAPLAAGEQLEQDAVRRAIGRHLHVLHVGAGQLLLDVLEKAAQLAQVALADLPRLRLDLPLVLHAEEAGRVVEGKLQLLAVEQVEQEDVVAPAAQHLQRRDAALGGVEQVGEHYHQAAAPRLLGGEV